MPFNNKLRVSKSKPDYSWQKDATNKIISIFAANLSRGQLTRTLLVIPTGGGKTRTALDTVHEMISRGLLFKDDEVMWVTNRLNLKEQLKDEFVLKEGVIYTKEEIDKKKILGTIFTICLPTKATEILLSEKRKLYKLIIIDEAHHSAASSYAALFKSGLNILGLTATPTRTDGVELPFSSIAYQITYRELLQRNVILKPEFISIDTNSTINLDKNDNLNDSALLNRKYNNPERNQIIVDAIWDAIDAHKRVIIFAGSNDHVDSLYELLRRRNKLEGQQYHVGYIYSEKRNGKTNEKGINNEDYLRDHKNNPVRSILVNCGILTEGYDDSTIDTVVLTVPTKSPLYYMQCVGRVVRRPSDETGIFDQKTYVLEFEDRYVNFVYRIDNAWLFADLSPYLEPIVINETLHKSDEFLKRIERIMRDHNVDDKYFEMVSTALAPESTSLLLFKSTTDTLRKVWYPIIFTPENRQTYVRLYNEFSDNISKNENKNPSFLIFDKLELEIGDPYFQKRESAFVNNLHRAMVLAYADKLNGKEVKRIKYYNFIVDNKTNHWLYDRIVIILRKIIRRLVNN